MPSATAASSDRLRTPQGLDGPSIEAIYRRSFSAIAAMPILFIALILAFAAFEHVRAGSIPPAEGIALSVVGPLLVALSSLWATVVWYGTYICLGETMISFHDTGMFFGVRTKTVPWRVITGVSLVNDHPWKRSVVLTLKEGAPLIIEGIPEPGHLCRHIEAKLSR